MRGGLGAGEDGGALEEGLVVESHELAEEEDHVPDPDARDKLEGGRWFNAYFSAVKRWHKAIVAFWLVVLAWSVWVGPEFLTMGNDNQNPPAGTRAYDDAQAFAALFPRKAKELPVLIVASCDDEGCDLTRDKAMQSFAKELFKAVAKYNATHGNVLDMMSYYSIDLAGVRGSFMSDSRQTTFMTVIESNDALTNDRYNFIKWLNARIEELHPGKEGHNKYTVGTTGFDAMALEGVDATADELKRVDSFTVPLAMALLAYMVRSWRLLIIAFINTGASIMLGFALMVILIKDLGLPRPESASAQLMEVMSLSLSIDYCLFLCRRFRDEIKAGADPETAVFRAMLTAGHVVLMSGITILAVFLGFLFLPARVVRMDGTSCAIGVACAIVIALTNTPALLLMFPRFFSTFDGCCGRSSVSELCCRPGKGAAESEDESQDQQRRRPLLSASSFDSIDGDGDGVGAGDGDRCGAEAGADQRAAGEAEAALDFGAETWVPPHPMYRGLRFRFTRFITQWPYNIGVILALYVMVIPLALQVTRLQVNQDIIVGIPRGSAAGDTFRRMVHDFHGGSFSPFYIVATAGPHHKSVLNAAAFEQMRDVAYTVLNGPYCGGDVRCVSSPALAGGRNVSVLEARALLATARSPLCRNPLWVPGEVCDGPRQYEFLFEQSVNEQRSAALTTIIVPFFPFAQNSSAFIDTVYDAMARFESDGMPLYLSGFEVAFDSIMRHVYHLFPMLIAITLGTVFVALGVMLRSAFVPVRLSLTLVLPLAFVFGLGVVVYQDGALSGLSASTKPLGGFYWYIPILITSISLALALDYDIFLISRIAEHRANHHDIQAAIVRAVCETGGTISAAGLIMTACFGGMLLSSQGTINESGWLLSTGVLLDTFVVNVALVPALMSVGDAVAWWPTRMPSKGLITLDHPHFTGRFKAGGATACSEGTSVSSSAASRE